MFQDSLLSDFSFNISKVPYKVGSVMKKQICRNDITWLGLMVQKNPGFLPTSDS